MVLGLEGSVILALDFDHVICDRAHPELGHKLGPPMPYAKEMITSLHKKGHYILIHSCNRPEVIAKWMAHFEIPYNSIWRDAGKPIADFYVDDRAVRFTSWAELGDDPRTW